ncbi:MAG: AAA family ATPase [Oscillospiraceae bacterium]|nr:AAA family ATPase [Oscillospiraceae bacterium]
MIIRNLRASFGKLENETLKLHDGLNVIYAPNESGKSTWCAFIRAMLYGVDSSERVRSGYLPDKLRYAPWSGAPMEGSMELRAERSDITLTRRTRAKGAPMRDFSAVYTGTAIPVEGMDGQNAGELLTGVSRDVFCRSAFIEQGTVAVSGSPELEKRINAIVSTGEEQTSYTEADEQLRDWQRKRRFHRKGALPTLEGQMDDVKQRLDELHRASEDLEQLEDQLAARQQDCARLESAMTESRRQQRRRALDNLNQGRKLLKQSSDAHDEALAALSQRREELTRGVFGGQNPQELEGQIQADLKTMKRLKDEGAAEKPIWPSLLLILVSLACAGLYTVWENLWLLLPSVLSLVAAIVMIIRLSSARRAAEAARSARLQLLKQYHARNEKELLQQWGDYQAQLYAVTQAEQRELDSRELYEQARQDLQELEDEAIAALDFSGGDSEAARLGRELAAARDDVERISSRIASLNGRLSVLGDPLVLASDLEQMELGYADMQTEYEALTLAIETLKEADTELQSRFSPELGRVASEYMAKVTGGRYADVLIDRDFSARARTQGDSVARESEYLSAGTLDLMYLAVRLAVCELAMPAGEPCPLIIDDALVNLDETRLDQAMQLLREIAKNRQVILFTCRKTE